MVLLKSPTDRSRVSGKTDDGERLEDDPDEYCVVCSCGEEFRICGNAIYHVEEEH